MGLGLTVSHDSKFPWSIVQRPLLHILMFLPLRFPFYLSLALLCGYFSLRLPVSFLFSPSPPPKTPASPGRGLLEPQWLMLGAISQHEPHLGWSQASHWCWRLSQSSCKVTQTGLLAVGLGGWHKGSKASRGPCPLRCSSKVLMSHILRVTHTSSASLAPAHMNTGLCHNCKGPVC